MELHDTKPNASLFASDLFIPGWLYHFFFTNFFENKTETVRIIPQLSVSDLGQMVIILNLIAEKLLHSQTMMLKTTVTLSSEELERHLKLPGKKSSQMMMRLLEQILALRVVRASNDQSHSLTVRLFDEDSWQIAAQDKFLLSLTINQEILPLFLGYTDPYCDFMQRIQNRPSTSGLFSGLQPLITWRALWLDLTSAEQLQLLRFETAAQFKKNCVHLNGFFCDDLPTFATDFQKSLTQLQKFGRKLRDHGLIQDGEDSYVATIPTDYQNQSIVLWQMSRLRLNDLFDLTLRNLVAKFYFKRWSIDSEKKKLFSLLSLGIHSSAVENEQQLLWSALDATKDSSSVYDGQNNVWDARLLFIEWRLRQKKGHRLPVSESLTQHPLFIGCLSNKNLHVVEQFQQFSALLAAEQSIEQILNQESTALITKASLENELDLKWMLSSILETNSSGNQPFAKKSGVSTPKIDTPMTVRPGATAADLSRTKLRKIALDELTQMMKAAPEHYLGLKQKYFESLDPSSLQLIRDVERKMQPTLFAEHIKQRLVNFMLDHPSLWKTAEFKTQNYTNLMTRI